MKLLIDRCLAGAALMFSLVVAVQAEAGTETPVPAISWYACSPDGLPSAIEAYLGSRLECGSMRALMANTADAENVYAGFMDVGLVRVKAGDPSQRLGSLFVNYGGPGVHPMPLLPLMAYVWSMHYAGSSSEGMRNLASRYDLVAVIPRGLKGSTEISCRSIPSVDPRIRADEPMQWQATVEIYKRAATTCTDWRRQFIGTSNHVADMEQARRALGEPSMNFLGISYGTWVGAFYAATYPEHTGRMVLDSSMNYAGTFEEQLEAGNRETQAAFHRYVIQPAVANSRYGLGNDADAILERFRKMPPRALSTWAPQVSTPEQLVAALTLAEWSGPNGTITDKKLRERLPKHRFGPDDVLNGSIRSAAEDLLRSGSGWPVPPPAVPADMNFAAYSSVVCGDTPWRKTLDHLRSKAMTHAFLFPAAQPSDLVMGLLCRSWPFPAKQRPALEQLAKAPPLLIVQAEFDPATPLSLAKKAFVASPGAYMLLAQDLRDHGIFASLKAPCVEDTASRFLLTGELPSKRFSTCKPAPTRTARIKRSSPDDRAVVEDALRALRAALTQAGRSYRSSIQP